MAPSTPSTPYPPGATNAYWFSLFNAFSFQITLGSPMILYAKSLGASATVLGVIAALTPLLTIAQIPAARFLANVGYRKFIFRGWGLRTVLVFIIAAVPLLSFLDNLGKITLVLFCLFGFNLLRGIASGAWLPWMTDLIPEEARGRFLSRDQVFQNLGSLSTLLLCSVILSGDTQPWQFAVLFLLSATGGTMSLFFVLRIPDIVARETLLKSNMRVPWKEIVTYPPFLQLVIFTLCWVFTVGAVGVFTVSFFKTRLGYSESEILFLSALFFAGALASLPLVGRLLDRTGSKVVLQSAMVISIACHGALWLLGANVLEPTLLLLCVMNFFNGIAGANFGLAHVRLVMNTMPPMGRSHFFAFFTVISSLGLGISPIAWGLIIDAIGEHEWVAGSFRWNRFSVFYVSVLALLVITLLFSTTLKEKAERHRRVDPRERVFRGNLRRILRLWQR